MEMLFHGKRIDLNGQEKTAGEVLETVMKQFPAEWESDDEENPVVAAILDNSIHDLQNPVEGVAAIDFVRLDTTLGWRVYRRSVTFLLILAVHELEARIGRAEVKVDFSANKGLFIEVEKQDGSALTAADVEVIAQRMREIVAEDRPIEKHFLPRKQVVALFRRIGAEEKARLVEKLRKDVVSVYHCGDYDDYLYGAMLGRTGQLGRFGLDFCAPGMLLRTPDTASAGQVPAIVAQPKLSHVLADAKRWADILDCDYVTDLNRAYEEGRIGDIIRISEALQEKKIAEIADHIASQKKLRLILIAGPSSSGKTSFAQRLRVQLFVTGLKPVSISLDNYFVSRKDTPRTPEGAYDYEALEALDVPLLNQQILALLRGESVSLPYYNFVTGERESGHFPPFSIRPDQPIIIEGIHGLNERLSAKIPREYKYKIYVSALTQLNIDAHNRIPTTDARLVRRLVRDYQFRGSAAFKTLRQWPDVRRGEEKNIFPFQEEADVMFNSALIYELGVLKKYVVPLLESVPREVPEHIEAQRLLDICQYFDDIRAEDEVPNNSLLREFIGRSVFFK